MRSTWRDWAWTFCTAYWFPSPTIRPRLANNKQFWVLRACNFQKPLTWWCLCVLVVKHSLWWRMLRTECQMRKLHSLFIRKTFYHLLLLNPLLLLIEVFNVWRGLQIDILIHLTVNSLMLQALLTLVVQKAWNTCTSSRNPSRAWWILDWLDIYTTQTWQIL